MGGSNSRGNLHPSFVYSSIYATSIGSHSVSPRHYHPRGHPDPSLTPEITVVRVTKKEIYPTRRGAGEVLYDAALTEGTSPASVNSGDCIGLLPG